MDRTWGLTKVKYKEESLRRIYEWCVYNGIDVCYFGEGTQMLYLTYRVRIHDQTLSVNQIFELDELSAEFLMAWLEHAKEEAAALFAGMWDKKAFDRKVYNPDYTGNNA